MKSIPSLFFTLIFLLSCNTNQQNDSSANSSGSYNNIPVDRSSVNPKPVSTYSETINSFETTDQFIVSLYETKETFHYLIRIQYKSLEEDDTLKIPNFGIMPSVEIKKGNTRPSCIVGFLDKDKIFRESKLIYFEDDNLKIHVLKHYAVLVSQDTIK